MKKQEAESLLRGMLEEITLEKIPKELDGDRPLKEQLELDSMDFLDFAMTLRKKHNLKVPEKDYPKLQSLRSATEYLLEKTNSPP